MIFVHHDYESYPNIFTATFFVNDKTYQFEVSWRRNDSFALYDFLDWCVDNYVIHVGFNNEGYDYNLTHAILNFDRNYPFDAADVYVVNEWIINTPWKQRFSNIIPAHKRLIRQLDLYKMCHFDNEARNRSLKELEFLMRSPDIQDLPFEPGIPIPETDKAAETLLFYNDWDVQQTRQYSGHVWKEVEFRLELCEEFGKDFINYNDTKIGKKYFEMCLEKAGVKVRNDDYTPVQTHRPYLDLGELIFPYVQFERPEFQAVVKQLQASRITETKGALKIKTKVDGFEFVFALGGIHGSVSSETFHSDDDYVIIDADVASYYPNIAIKNRVYPEHLSEVFCDVYQDVFMRRKSFPKGTPMNAAMKLALNGVYGDSNSKFSIFYDPKYTMTTTINGQLLLCMLSEQLIKIPGCTMIQINTDGLTVRCPRKYLDHYYAVCDWWQQMTMLELEYVEYASMYVRDVNNYIAVSVDGKVKKKGAYVDSGAHDGGELGWEKNHDCLVVQKAAVAAILDGISVPEFIRNHDNIYDFFLMAKVGRKDRLELRNDVLWDGVVVHENQLVERQQRVSRYYVSHTGDRLIKTMKPLKRRTNKVEMVYRGWISRKVNGVNKNLTVENQYEYDNAVTIGYRTKDGGTYTYGPERQIALQANHLVTMCNNVQDLLEHPDGGNWMNNIDYGFYIAEAEKLVNGVLGLR